MLPDIQGALIQLGICIFIYVYYETADALQKWGFDFTVAYDRYNF